MKINWTARTLLAEPLNRVDVTPDGEEQGGGQEAGKATGAKDPAAGDDEDMGPAGQDALRKERDLNRTLQRQLAELKNMSPQIAEQVAEAGRRVEEANERVRRAEEDKTRAVDETRSRLEQKHKRDRDSLQAERDAAIAAKEQLAIRTAFNEAFNAADGRPGGEDGLTHSEAVFNQLAGNLMLKDGRTIVVDRDGDPIMAADKSGPIELKDWLNLKADSSSVIGVHFKPVGGAGSGGLLGARGYRPSQGRDPKDLAKMTPNQLLNSAYPD
jgi:hypothetical protein